MKQSAMFSKLSLEQLWDLPAPHKGPLTAECLENLPESARRYLLHSIAPGTALATAVRLRMHGEIKLRTWMPFTAEQVIRCDQSMIWRASVRLHGLQVQGFDCVVGGEGGMAWKLFGTIPLMRASGPDIDRSARGRVEAESVWLPSHLCGKNVSLEQLSPSSFQANIHTSGETDHVHFEVEPSGRLSTVHLQRWGNPDDRGFRYDDFGAVIEEENTFQGYTIPTHLRAGWHFREGEFGSGGEFFHVIVDKATFK